MTLDGRGQRAGRVTRRLAEARGPVPPFALVRRRQRRRAWRHAAVLVAAVVAAAAVVTVQVRQHAGEDLVSRPRSLGRVGATVRLGGQLGDVRVGADAVWVQRGREVVRVDPQTNRVLGRVPLGPPGSGLGAVAGGSLWLTHLSQETVTRVDAATGRTVATIRVPGAGNAPQGMVVAPAPGAVWAGYAQGGTDLARIDPATNTVAATVPLPGPPNAIAAGGRAVLVVTNESSVAYQVDPATNRVVARIGVCSQSNDVAYAAGAFWVGCGEGRLLRVDPAAHRVAATVELGGAFGSAVTVGADERAVWVANLNDVLLRVDPQTNAVLGSLPVTGSGGGYLTGMAVGPGAVWLTTSAGMLVRFDPNG
jgi:virginiamycin B lyase